MESKARFLANAAALAEIAWEHQELPIYVTYGEGHIEFEAPEALNDMIMAALLSITPNLVTRYVDE